ncbi:hypothetical protein RR42_m2589 [Cupriavidus basilensis]|uniref:Uncharacterized protein n=2 Tax=Cupriavidus basilensis TaxID=68895 RepID=A0A0C4YAK5_9BURK|nr:hypothetical protein RR42_m2589 [Cupriavidus basilensis]
MAYTDLAGPAASRAPTRRTPAEPAFATLQEEVMAVIVIKDLPDSVDLDREAMVAITGGARTRAGHAWTQRKLGGALRVISYPEGFPGQPLAGTQSRPAGDIKRK